MPDLRNHGESEHARSMGYVQMAADVKLLLEELGIERCCVIGHSMGGKAAAALALMFPEMVESVAILDMAPVAYTGQHGKVCTHLLLCFCAYLGSEWGKACATLALVSSWKIVFCVSACIIGFCFVGLLRLLRRTDREWHGVWGEHLQMLY